MADAYAKASGELTLVSVHSGPGLTNAITGIAEAAKSRTSMLVLAGDVPTGAVTNNFYIEQGDLVRSVGAVSERIHTAASAREDARRAVVRAMRDRQTVVLSLPLDVQDAPMATNVGPLELPPAPGRLYPDPDAVRRLAEAVARGNVRSSSAAAAPCCRMPKARSLRSPTAPVRCWRRPCAATACLRGARGRSASAAASHRRRPTK